jgi:hypothetical protein
MANLPISVLPNVLASGVTLDDLLVIVNYDVPSGTTKNITTFDLQTYVTSGITDDIITGGTYSGGTLVLNTPGGPINISGFTEPFSGGSGNCITDLYISNLHGCSPITIHDSVQYTGSTASGVLSVAEGRQTTASGDYSHSEGFLTSSYGVGSHAEGRFTQTGKYGAYLSGPISGGIVTLNSSYGDATTYFYSGDTVVIDDTNFNSDIGRADFTISAVTFSSPNTIIYLNQIGTTCTGNAIIGNLTGIYNWFGDQIITSDYSHSQGSGTVTIGFASSASGYYSAAIGDSSTSSGFYSRAYGNSSNAEGRQTKSIGNASHSEGRQTTASGYASHSEGFDTKAIGERSHSEGYLTIAYGSVSHAEGSETNALGNVSHSEGQETISIGIASHAEGSGTITSGDSSHAEGWCSVTFGPSSHAEGGDISALISGGTTYGIGSHAEGMLTKTFGYGSHAEGYGTVTDGDYQHAQGMWNVTGDTTQGAFIVGNGTNTTNRSNLVFAAGNEVNISGKTITTNLQVTSGATNGYVLTSDASGNASWQTPSGGYTYEIGQYVPSEGGVIAHRWLSTIALGSPEAGTVQNYLVVDIDDLSESAPFLTGPVIPGTNYFSSWDGLSNNTNLIANGGGGVGTAVYICVNSTNNGKTDWYLPAIDELSKIYQNRFDIAQGLINAGGTQMHLWENTLTDYYYSSTAIGESAFLFNFSHGQSLQGDNSNSYIVRAVRKFSI